jgi:hypothetical protein
MASNIVDSGLLGPVIALNGWTFVMETWMYATRLPVFTRLKIADNNTLTKTEIDAKVPASVRWKADNYNHLFEQPTQFYAVTLALALARGGHDKTDVALAWSYVGLRVLHSLVQCTTNNIPRRFLLFLTSSGVLAWMTTRAAKLLLAKA